jgi:hypothetical protein
MIEVLILSMQGVLCVGLLPIYGWVFRANREIGELRRDVTTVKAAVNGANGIPGRCNVHAEQIAEVRRVLDRLTG